ncbi:predicted protein [Botrytis cinerea T4]|uniref:Uncharacterized protein n=1 Tax=Botryotinia fuckeliana (strain T4) TaxID=999810 RepID=G2XUM1_BOTF4|nr:predicted protein [Botrytis cinerea T4]
MRKPLERAWKQTGHSTKPDGMVHAKKTQQPLFLQSTSLGL